MCTVHTHIDRISSVKKKNVISLSEECERKKKKSPGEEITFTVANLVVEICVSIQRIPPVQ